LKVFFYQGLFFIDNVTVFHSVDNTEGVYGTKLIQRESMEQSGAWDQTCTYISQLNTETFLFNYWSY